MFSLKAFVVATTLLFGVAQSFAITKTVYVCGTDPSHTSTYVPEYPEESSSDYTHSLHEFYSTHDHSTAHIKGHSSHQTKHISYPSKSSLEYAASPTYPGNVFQQTSSSQASHTTYSYGHSHKPSYSFSISSNHTYSYPNSGSSYTHSSTRTSSSLTSTSSAAPHCTNGPESRDCWKHGFDINTDQDHQWPITGKVVKYELEVVNKTLAVDGIDRQVLVVNGQYPGPVITADWGDTLQITVKNALKDNGTSIHWHGIRQLHTGVMDGTNGVTECPIAPGQEKVYTFLCTQHGTTWCM